MDDPAPVEAVHPPRVADRRGLTATGALAVALVVGAVGITVDSVRGSGLHAGFAACFVLGATCAALLVHREDLRAAVVMQPLVYLVLALTVGAVGLGAGHGSPLSAAGVEAVQAVVLQAPVLLVGTAAALATAVARGLVGRRRR